MRNLSTAQSNILSLPYRSTHMRVLIDRGSSDWVDMSTLEGWNWIQGVEYADTQDNAVSTATIHLYTQQGEVIETTNVGLSLSPLVGGKINASGVVVDVGNPIKIDTATLSPEELPASGDWVNVFHGIIDEVEIGEDVLTVHARNNAGVLVDTFIESLNTYGTEAGRAVEDVIQDILTAHATSTTYLYSVNGDDSALPGSAFAGGDSPGFNIIPYSLEQTDIMSAIRQLAQLVGADITYKYHAATSAFHLQWLLPSRGKAAVGALTFSGQPSATQKVTINGVDQTAIASGAGANQFNIGADFYETAKNLTDCINASTSSLYGTCSAAVSSTGATAIVYVIWGTIGTAGNSITFTETMSNVAIDGGGVLGATVAGTAGPTSVNYTFGPEDYTAVQAATRTRYDVRNVLEGAFVKSGSDEIQTIKVLDTTSITNYGRRYAKITAGSTNQIDTVTEMIQLLIRVLSDLREPTLIHTLEVPYFWAAEPYDLYAFTANGVHYDSTQTLTLHEVRHRLSRDSAVTTLSCRSMQ